MLERSIKIAYATALSGIVIGGNDIPYYNGYVANVEESSYIRLANIFESNLKICADGIRSYEITIDLHVVARANQSSTDPLVLDIYEEITNRITNLSIIDFEIQDTSWSSFNKVETYGTDIYIIKVVSIKHKIN